MMKLKELFNIFKRKKSKYKNPCEDGKCIAYPICINKTEVRCPILQDYVTKFTHNNMYYKKSGSPVDYPELQDKYYKSLWKDLHKFLPKATRVNYIEYHPERYK